MVPLVVFLVVLDNGVAFRGRVLCSRSARKRKWMGLLGVLVGGGENSSA